MAGHGELFAAAHARGFDEHDVAAPGRPRPTETPGFGAVFDLAFGRNLGMPSDSCTTSRHHRRSVLPSASRRAVARGGDLAFQIAHASFARVAVDDFPANRR
jgi:hypothetical protein